MMTTTMKLDGILTSTNALWIRNCRHALGGLAGSRQTLLDVQQRAAGGRHGRHFESMTSCQKFDSSLHDGAWFCMSRVFLISECGH